MTRLAISIFLGALALLALAVPHAQAGVTGQRPDLVADPPARVSIDQLDVEGSERRLIRFDGFIRNSLLGGMLEIQASDARDGRMSTVEQVIGGSRRPLGGRVVYETSDGHNHWHLQEAARYSLWSADGAAEVAPAQKVGFCMTDTRPIEEGAPETATWRGCGGQASNEIGMGISPGWRDDYPKGLWFQWVDASDVAPGSYRLRSQVDPLDLVEETNEVNPAAETAVTIPGWNAKPLALPLETTAIRLEAAPAGGEVAGPDFRIEDPPRHGFVDRPTGVWFTNPDLSYRRAPGAPAGAGDSFTVSARERGTPFPLSPRRATIAIGVPAGGDGAPPSGERVLLSGVPGRMVAGTSVQLRADVVGGTSSSVRWSATRGTIGPDGTFRAPAKPATAVVRATSPGGASAEARIEVVARRAVGPVPAACSGRATRVRSALGRLCARRVGGAVLARVTARRSGRLRLSLRQGRRVLRRCAWRARAGRAYGCRFRVKRSRRGLAVVVAQRRRDGRVLTRRLRVR